MIKVRIFRYDAYDSIKLEEAINTFLEQKITVRRIYSFSAGGNSGGCDIITQVVYEDSIKEGSRWVYSEPDLMDISREG